MDQLDCTVRWFLTLLDHCAALATEFKNVVSGIPGIQHRETNILKLGFASPPG